MLGSTLRCYVGQYTGGIPVDPSLQVKLQSCTDGNVCLTGNCTLKQELGGVKIEVSAAQGICTGRAACSGNAFCNMFQRETPGVTHCKVK